MAGPTHQVVIGRGDRTGLLQLVIQKLFKMYFLDDTSNAIKLYVLYIFGEQPKIFNVNIK